MVCMVFLSVLVVSILPLGHDLWYHMYRIGSMGIELQKNPFGLPIRILSDTFNQYGYGAALYYGDLFLYLPAYLFAIGIDVVVCYKILLLIILWLTFGISYFSFRMLDKSSESACIFAISYTFSSSALLNLCIRSAIGESLSLAFLPLIFCSFFNILERRKNRISWVLLSVAMTCVALSHMLSLLLSIFTLLVWSLIESRRFWKKECFSDICKAALLTAGLSASFVFPMFEQMFFQKVQTPTNSQYQQREFLLYAEEPIDFLIPYELKKIFVEKFNISWNIEQWHPGGIGILVVILLIFFLRNRKNIKREIQMLWWISFGALLSLWIMPWMHILKLFFFFAQFPWRILPFICLGLSIVTANICMVEPIRKKELVVMVILCGIYVIGSRYAYQFYVQKNGFAYIKENNPDYYEKYLYRYDSNMADNLYLPEGVPFDTFLNRGETVTSSNIDCDFSWKRTKNGIEIVVNKNELDNTIFELPLYMYKGYAANDFGGNALPIVKNNNGLVHVSIPKGNDYKIVVYYAGTKLQKYSDCLTLMSLIVLILILVRGKFYDII